MNLVDFDMLSWTKIIERSVTGLELGEENVDLVISWRFSVNIFWNAMHLAQKVDHQSWILRVQNLPFEPKIYIIAIIGDISWDCNAIWRKEIRHKTANLSYEPYKT